MAGRLSAIHLILAAGLLVCCCTKRADIHHTTFTKVDSLTDFYLSLQDSVLRSWNIMIYDDNQKVKSMRNLLHELQVTAPNDGLKIYEEKLDRLKELRYDQASMADENVIEQYDLASKSLATEIINIAEGRTEFAYNTTLQKLVQEIRIADQRASLFRTEYDVITKKYNSFLQTNRNYLYDISQKDSIELRPLFQPANGD